MAAAPGRLDALLHNLSQRLVQAPALPAIPAEAETAASSTHLHGAATAATSSSSARSPYSELFAWTSGAGRLVRGGVPMFRVKLREWLVRELGRLVVGSRCRRGAWRR